MNKRNPFNNKKAFRFKRFARKTYSVFNSIHKSVTIGVLSGVALMSAHAAAVIPVERVNIDSQSDSISLTQLDEVVVTASTVDLPMNLATKLVTVITSAEIEQAPVRSIEDLLNYVAGVDVLQRGPHGVQADVSLRGGSFDQAAILLNGINLTNPHTGHYSFDIPINLSDIERIEIVQGPSCLVYGSSAFSGGINIITKKDTESNAYAKLEGGMHGLFGAEVRGAYKTKSSVHSLSTGYKSSDGYIANSDYEIVNLLWQSQFEVNNANIDFQFGYNDKDYGANTFYTAAYPNQYEDTESFFASVRGETMGKLKFIPQFYMNRHFDEFQLIREGTPDIPSWYTDHNYHRSDVFGMNMAFQYTSKLGISSFGSEFRNEGILSNVLGKQMNDTIGKYTKSDNRTNMSYFLEHNFIVDKFSLSLGGLLNQNSALVNKVNLYPSINASYRPNNNVSIYASWNKATRMPTFTDLYYTTKTHTGNTNLTTENSQSLEVGIKLKNHFLRATVSAFYMISDNLIDWLKPSPDALWESRNLTRIDKSGVESYLTLDMEQILGREQPLRRFDLGYTYLNQNKVADEWISNYTLNHLKHKFTAGLTHNIVENMTMSWNFRWQEREGSYVQYVNTKPGEKIQYKPFSVLDIKLNYKLNDLNLFVNGNNIFNKMYVDLGNIPQPGFWLSGGINYSFTK
ncbi:MAG: TonB-dependent receptor [Dysgonamonadaceae bacterium]